MKQFTAEDVASVLNNTTVTRSELVYVEGPHGEVPIIGAEERHDLRDDPSKEAYRVVFQIDAHDIRSTESDDEEQHQCPRCGYLPS